MSRYYTENEIKEFISSMEPEHAKVFGQPNALQITGKLYPAGMDSAKPVEVLPESNERDNKDLAQKGF